MGNLCVVPLLHSVSDMITKQVKIKKNIFWPVLAQRSIKRKQNPALTSRNSYRPLTKVLIDFNKILLRWLARISRPMSKKQLEYTGCPTRYRTRHFFNNSNTNEDIATKFEQGYVRGVRNEEECVCSVR
jgi:hypothetical protein